MTLDRWAALDRFDRLVRADRHCDASCARSFPTTRGERRPDDFWPMLENFAEGPSTNI